MIVAARRATVYLFSHTFRRGLDCSFRLCQGESATCANSWLLEKPKPYEGNSAVPVALPRAALAVRGGRPPSMPRNFLQRHGSTTRHTIYRIKDDPTGSEAALTGCRL